LKKQILTHVVQKDTSFWILKEDPRKIALLLPDIEVGAEQDAQRPWIKKKVVEIRDYVNGRIKFQGVEVKCKGILPTALVLDIKEPLKIEKDEQGQYFILIPETPEEIEEYRGSLDAIDGQHRIRSFLPNFLHPEFKDSEKYEMIFAIFENLGLEEKRELFLITNEKQESISKNLLRKFKKWLKLLDSTEEELYDIVEGLNKENFSPLKNKIIIGEAKITSGWRESQVSKVLKTTGTYDKLKCVDILLKQKIISNYLKAWESVYNVKIKENKHSLSKISGFRYVMYFFPLSYETLIAKEKHATIENFKNIIEKTKLLSEEGNVFNTKELKFALRGEGGTIKIAQEHIEELEKILIDEIKPFDPSKGI